MAKPMITSTMTGAVAEIVVDHPPVNALPVAGWFELADALRAAGADRGTRVVVLRAEGRGFNAGVDIKEIQAAPGFTALIGANRSCFAAFAAVYECAVPVIAAVEARGGQAILLDTDRFPAAARLDLRFVHREHFLPCELANLLKEPVSRNLTHPSTELTY